MYRLYAFAIILALAATPEFVRAQDTAPLQISGIVFEPGGDGISLRVSGAQVTLSASGRPEIVAATFTDSNGAFEFHPPNPGEYVIEVKKEGYSPVYNKTLTLEVAPGRFLGQLPFFLTRPGQLTGRVIDEDGQPVADLEVTVQQKSLGRKVPAVTAKDGTFTAPDLQPGSYIVRISPPSSDRENLVPKFSDDDLKIVDQALETSYWPGGSSEPSATIPANPGVSANIGTIKVREVPYHRAHVSVATGVCTPGETWEFSLLNAHGPLADASLRFSGDLPCTHDFLLRNLSPGSYWFELRELEPERDRWALASVGISNRNLEVALTLQPEAEIVGRFVAADGATLPPFDNVRVSTKVETVGFAAGGSLASVDSEGKFALRLKFPRHHILVVGLTKQYYVKEFRFNGAPAGGVVTLSPGMAQLEIVIDDKPGVITGTVSDGDKPADRAVVTLFTPSLQPVASQPPAFIDKQGRFQITGLAPGEYGAVAWPMAARIDHDSTDAMSRLAANAETIRVERGGTSTVSLKLTDPSR